MVRFLFKTFLFGLFGIGVLYIVFSSENGNADPFHLKLVGPKQQFLILGNSKAAQGLIPDILDSIVSDIGYPKFYNFSFALGMSSYGPVYYRSIQEKLDPKTQNGKFIVAVDAWSVMADKKHPEDEKLFPEWDLPLAHVKSNSSKPNIKYLLQWYPYPNYEILLRRWRPANEILHTNGWLEVNVPMGETDQAWRLAEKERDFINEMQQNTLSEIRLYYLSKTIQFLGKHGTVYLVRIPSHHNILDLENKMIPDFNGRICELAQENKVEFLDLSEKAEDFLYTDGVHMHHSSSRSLSRLTGEWINQNPYLTD
jgi:hypothetical protein